MKQIFAILCASVCLANCTSTEALGERALEYNKELEESTNTAVLLNVVRASKRLPMTFSRLGSMANTGSLGATPSASFGVGANSGSANDVLGFSMQSNDSGVTQLEALTGQKYHRAINQSISPEQVSYYRDRGWSDVILFSLFIEKIEMELDFFDNTITRQVCGNYRTDEDQGRCKKTKTLLLNYLNRRVLSDFLRAEIEEQIQTKNRSRYEESPKPVTLSARDCSEIAEKAPRLVCEVEENVWTKKLGQASLSEMIQKDETQKSRLKKFMSCDDAAVLPEGFGDDEKKAERKAQQMAACRTLLAIMKRYLAARVEQEEAPANAAAKGKTEGEEVRALADKSANTDPSKPRFVVFDNNPDDVRDYKRFRGISATVINNYNVNLEDKPKPDYYPSPYCIPPSEAQLVGDRADQVDDETDATSKTKTERFSETDCKSLNGWEPVGRLDQFNEIDLKAMPAGTKILRGVVFRKQKTSQILSFTAKNIAAIDNDGIGCTLSIGQAETSEPGNCQVRVVLRSPKDMIYYLGELIRAQNSMGTQYCPDQNKKEFRIGFEDLCTTKTSEESLFWLDSSDNILTVRQGGIANNKLFPFEYAGALYWVPADESLRGRTMQIVALLNELFYANQEASDAPVVSVIQGATVR